MLADIWAPPVEKGGTIVTMNGSNGIPAEVSAAFGRVCEEAMKSCAYFHTWWSLSNLAMTRDEVFEAYGVTPNEIRALVEAVRTVLNEAGRRLGWPTVISEGERQERATMAILRRLAGEGVAPG